MLLTSYYARIGDSTHNLMLLSFNSDTVICRAIKQLNFQL